MVLNNKNRHGKNGKKKKIGDLLEINVLNETGETHAQTKQMNSSNGKDVFSNGRKMKNDIAESSCKHRESTDIVEKDESRVLVLYTGGTIGMKRNEDKELVPVPNYLAQLVRRTPHMHDEEYAKKRLGNISSGPLVLPNNLHKHRILYSIYEYNPLLDSSNMTMDDWKNLALDIRQAYESFEGFVILHGTDTLAYTASALSFMLENLGKTVVVTGSQIPLADPRSDGWNNFVSSLILAGNYNIPEVTVFFGNKLMRGNRTTKISAQKLDAFDSPNFQPIATVGINIDVDYKSIFRPQLIEKFAVHSDLNRNVGILRLFPSITSATVHAFLQPPMQGVVLQTYGSGNVPSNREDLMEEIEEATKRGVIIVNCTQCPQGGVSALYETGAALLRIGVTPGCDMTPEAVLTKLTYVLSKDEWDINVKRQMMQTSLRGELFTSRAVKFHTMDLIDAVAQSLQMSSPDEIKQAGEILYPAMLCDAVARGDIEKLDTFKMSGANMSACNSDYRTPLHVACSLGKLKIVQYLLLNGASVHIKDRFGKTPLMDAIEFDHHEVITVLLKCGAHLVSSPTKIGMELCSAAERGQLERLKSYQLAGADMNQSDHSNRTPLHMAALHGKEECVKFLLAAGADVDVQDMLGYTAYALAETQKHAGILKLLQKTHQLD